MNMQLLGMYLISYHSNDLDRCVNVSIYDISVVQLLEVGVQFGKGMMNILEKMTDQAVTVSIIVFFRITEVKPTTAGSTC